MTTASSGILPKGKSGGDGFYYLLAALSGGLAGWLDIKVGDLLLTAMGVLAANILLGILRPRRPWRWVVLIGGVVPVVEWLSDFLSFGEAGAGADLRIVSGVSAGNCRRVRRSRGARCGGQFVCGEVAPALL